MRAGGGVLAVVAAASVACGSRGANGRACEAWAEQVNGMECLALSYDASNLCDPLDREPALAGEEPAVDLRPWFDCLGDHLGCAAAVPDGRPDVLEACPAPRAPEPG